MPTICYHSPTHLTPRNHYITVVHNWFCKNIQIEEQQLSFYIYQENEWLVQNIMPNSKKYNVYSIQQMVFWVFVSYHRALFYQSLHLVDSFCCIRHHGAVVRYLSWAVLTSYASCNWKSNDTNSEAVMTEQYLFDNVGYNSSKTMYGLLLGHN